jgi:hypothetical protein
MKLWLLLLLLLWLWLWLGCDRCSSDDISAYNSFT